MIQCCELQKTLRHRRSKSWEIHLEPEIESIYFMLKTTYRECKKTQQSIQEIRDTKTNLESPNDINQLHYVEYFLEKYTIKLNGSIFKRILSAEQKKNYERIFR